jgi:hypothetical protein
MHLTKPTWATDGEAVAWWSIANHRYIIMDLLPLDALEYKLACCGIGHIHALLI